MALCPYCKIPMAGSLSPEGQVVCHKCGRAYAAAKRPNSAASSAGVRPPPPPARNPPGPVAEPEEDREPAPLIQTEATSVSSVRLPRRRLGALQTSNSFFDLFDFGFTKYVTPWVIRATWILILGWTGLTIGLVSIGFLVEAASSVSSDGSTAGEREPRPSSDSFSVPRVGSPSASRRSSTFDRQGYNQISAVAWRVFAFVTALGSAILFLLWSRVVLETVIVLFNMAESLKAIQVSAEKWTAPRDA